MIERICILRVTFSILFYMKQVANIVGEEEIIWAEEKARLASQKVQIVYLPISNAASNAETVNLNETQSEHQSDADMESFFDQIQEDD